MFVAFCVPRMGFFGFIGSSTVESIIPEEEELLKAMRAAYRDPNVTTTKALHQVNKRLVRLCMSARHIMLANQSPLARQAVLDGNPKWTVNLKRVRKLLPKVASTDTSGLGAVPNINFVEEDIDDWCLITRTVPQAVVATTASRRGRS